MGLLVAAALSQFHQDDFAFAAVLMFCVGMTAASARRVFAKPLKIPQWVLSTGIVGCLALVLLLFKNVCSTLPILILGVAFVLVMFDGTLFGLLLTRPAKTTRRYQLTASTCSRVRFSSWCLRLRLFDRLRPNLPGAIGPS
jgi:hypothetical protein